LQNRMHERDFVSNHDEQQRIQNESFETNYWYEKRRGEFVIDDEDISNLGVEIVSNQVFAFCYVSFWLQKPVHAIMNMEKFFITKAESPSGLYEFIFNQNTNFREMLSAYFVWIHAFSIFAGENEDGERFLPEPVADFVTPVFALSKIVLEKMLFIKYKAEINMSEYLIRNFESMSNFELLDSKTELSILIKDIIKYCSRYVYEKLSLVDNENEFEVDDKTESGKQLKKLMTEESYFEVLKHELENKKIKLQDLKIVKKKIPAKEPKVSRVKKTSSK